MLGFFVMEEEKRIKSKVRHENIMLLLSRNKEANRWIEGECRKIENDLKVVDIVFEM